MYSSWADGIIHVFPTVQRMESLTDYLFAGATESAGPEEAVAELLTDFPRLDYQVQNLQAQVDKDFSGELALAAKAAK